MLASYNLSLYKLYKLSKAEARRVAKLSHPRSHAWLYQHALYGFLDMRLPHKGRLCMRPLLSTPYHKASNL